eukprot:TRINITY_DN5494_c0_g1_i1.p1 TRINITY_DN5494_c0_g1~~TRINITY_DN5494_c0_g1_i1.p1  ORF type:complete len:904 (+),score=252.21 TRINITY_DN5494_c0_g1_i1:123-2834(+)
MPPKDRPASRSKGATPQPVRPSMSDLRQRGSATPQPGQQPGVPVLAVGSGRAAAKSRTGDAGSRPSSPRSTDDFAADSGRRSPRLVEPESGRNSPRIEPSAPREETSLLSPSGANDVVMPPRQGSDFCSSPVVSRRGSALSGRQSNASWRKPKGTTYDAQTVDDPDDDDDNPFRQTLAPSSPMASLERRGSNVYQRNQLAADVQERRASMAQLKQEELEAKAKEADTRRAQAKQDKFDRPKRELLCQRTVIWLQVLMGISLPGCLKQSAAETRAKQQLTVLWLPMMRRWKMLRERRRIRAQYIMSQVPEMQTLKLEPADLKKIDFFEEWRPYNLEKLIEAMVPDCYKPGEYIMMEGDWGMEMYVIARGTVEIVIRLAGPGGTKKKSRSKQDGLVVASLNESGGKRFFGEFSVLCHEPRTASVVAATECLLWRIGKKDIDAQLDLLPPRVRGKVLSAADQRRTQNMAKLFPLKEEKLTKAPENACPLFQCYPVPATQMSQIVKMFEPRVVRPGTVLFEQGDQGDLFYFIASGEIEIRKKRKQGGKREPAAARSPPSPSHGSRAPDRKPSVGTGLGQAGRRETAAGAEDGEDGDANGVEEKDYEVVARLGPGYSFGEVALIFLETRTATAVATQSSDLWVLKKDDLLMALMSVPEWFVEAKSTINRLRASWLAHPPADAWLVDGTLAKLVGHRFLKEITHAAEPRVLDRSVELAESGEEIHSVILVTEGVVRQARRQEAIHGPAVFGVPEVLTFQPQWFQGLKAERRCDCWVVTKSAFFAALRKHHPDVVHKLSIKEFQEQLEEEHKLPFQPWENKMAEFARWSGQGEAGLKAKGKAGGSARKPSALTAGPGSGSGPGLSPRNRPGLPGAPGSPAGAGSPRANSSMRVSSPRLGQQRPSVLRGQS